MPIVQSTGVSFSRTWNGASFKVEGIPRAHSITRIFIKTNPSLASPGGCAGYGEFLDEFVTAVNPMNEIRRLKGNSGRPPLGENNGGQVVIEGDVETWFALGAETEVIVFFAVDPTS